MSGKNRKKKHALPKTYPENSEWTAPGEKIEEIKVNHPIFRQAPKISIGLGIITAALIFIFREFSHGLTSNLQVLICSLNE